MAKTPAKPTVDADLSLLSAEDLAAIQAQAEASVTEERKTAATKKALDTAKEALRRKHDPKRQLVNVTIDVAEYTDRIVIDGTIYMHGSSYNVPIDRARVLQETMAKTWEHQAEIDGKPTRHYQKHHNVVLRPVAA